MLDSLPLLAWPGTQRPLLTILIFHRVLPVVDRLRPGEIDAETFRRYMSFLSRNFAVMPLIDATEKLKRGVLPQRACCVTFDDGYADNLTVALPILEALGLPARLQPLSALKPSLAYHHPVRLSFCFPCVKSKKE